MSEEEKTALADTRKSEAAPTPPSEDLARAAQLMSMLGDTIVRPFAEAMSGAESKQAEVKLEEVRAADKESSRRWLFLWGVLFVLAGVAAGALYQNRPELVMEMFKNLVLVVAGGGAGYGVARAREGREGQ